MKQIIIALILLFPFIKSVGQEASVENSIWGVQLGIYPISAYNEFKLTNTIALRSEVGFSFGWSSSSRIGGSSKWAVTPDVNVEPRYYYNLNRRSNLEKRTENNSGNYLSVNFGYGAGNLAITSKYTEVYPTIHVIPMYGLRRNIGKKFNFEFAFGVGYNWTYKDYNYVNFVTGKTQSFKETVGEVTLGIRLAIGYVFSH